MANLNSFSNTTNTPTQAEDGGWWGTTKWQANPLSKMRAAKIASVGAF